MASRCYVYAILAREMRLPAGLVGFGEARLSTARLALRGACLLDPSQVPAFREGFDAIRRIRPDLRFLLSGPWPPYSFVTPTEAGKQSAIGSPGYDLARRLSTEGQAAQSGEAAAHARGERASSPTGASSTRR